MAEPGSAGLDIGTGAPEAPKPESRLKKLWSGFKDKAGDFLRQNFKGELSDTEKKGEKEIGKFEVAKTLGLGLLGLVGTLTGTKVAVDVLRYFPQKYFTSAEKKSLEETFRHAEDLDATATHEQKVERRGGQIKEKIRASKYLTTAQKEAMLAKVDTIVTDHKEETMEAETARTKKIAELIEANIQTRVKGTTVIKETVNTVTMLSGLQAVRGLAYGGVALVERHQRIMKERGEGKREFEGIVGWGKEFVVRGFQEMWRGLTFSKTSLETGRQEPLSGRERFQNAAKAYGTLARFVGLGALAGQEILTDGHIGESIDTMLKAWEKKSASEFLADNFTANLNRLTFGQLFKPEHHSSHGRAGGGAGAPLGGPGMEAGGAAVAAAEAERLKEIGHDIPVVHGDPAHNSISALAEARAAKIDPTLLEKCPGKNLDQKVLGLLRQDGYIAPDGDDTRLTELAKNNLALDIQERGGRPTIVFLDAHTGQEVPKDVLESKFFYHHDAQTGKDIFPSGHEPRGAGGAASHGVEHRGGVASDDRSSDVTRKPDDYFVARQEISPGHAVFNASETAAYQSGDSVMRKFLEVAGTGAKRSYDELADNVQITGVSDRVSDLLDQQHLSLSPGGINADGYKSDLDWSRSVDINGHLINAEKVDLAVEGSALKVEVHYTDGSSNIFRFQDGKVVEADRLFPSAFSEALGISKHVLRRADDAFQKFVAEVQVGNYEAKTLSTDQLPPVKINLDNPEDVLAQHHLSLTPRGLEALRPRGDDFGWDKVFVGQDGSGIIKPEEVSLTVDPDSGDLFATIKNSNNTLDIVRYGSGGRIESIQRVPASQR